ncbi:hypothetical protein IV79_GL001394 [Pediococcus claussenii]|nr:hypothetical protein IV79_GL001394 [Pediococcus claussenii]
MILTAIYTDTRLGEIQALTWKNFNFNLTPYPYGVLGMKKDINFSQQKMIHLSELLNK